MYSNMRILRCMCEIQIKDKIMDKCFRKKVGVTTINEKMIETHFEVGWTCEEKTNECSS